MVRQHSTHSSSATPPSFKQHSQESSQRRGLEGRARRARHRHPPHHRHVPTTNVVVHRGRRCRQDGPAPRVPPAGGRQCWCVAWGGGSAEEARPAGTDFQANIHSLLSPYHIYTQANVSNPWLSLSRRPRWVVGLGWDCLARFGTCRKHLILNSPLPCLSTILSIPRALIRIDGPCTRGCLPGSLPGFRPDWYHRK